MTKRIGIVGVPDSPYVRDLRRAAQALESPPEVLVLHYKDLLVGLGAAVPGNLRAGREPPALQLRDADGHVIDVGGLDCLLVRSMPLGSLEQIVFRMDCLQVWADRGLRVVNSPRCLETSIDKWLTLHRLQQAGVPVPATRVCQSREAGMLAYEELGGDVLLKPLFGGEGRGIVRLQDADTAWRVLGAVAQIGQVLYVQQFEPHLGYDVRALLVGSQCFSVKRLARGSWLTNLARGSTAEPHELTPPEYALARRAADAVQGCIVGVDLLPTVDGRWLVLEVNAVPGWKGTAAALEIDIAKRVMQYAFATSKD